MKFEPLTEETFPLWDETCLQSEDACFLHTTITLQYLSAYKPDLKTKNLSFFVRDPHGQLLGLCPLFLETDGEGIAQFSLGGGHIPSPALVGGMRSRYREEILKEIFDEVDRRAQEFKVARCSFWISPLVSSCNFNYLVKHGYLDISINSQVIECQKPLDEIRREMRKGHVADTNKAAKILEMVVFDDDNIAEDIFRAYQDLHLKAAGRMTRPQRTFDLMHEMIKTKNAFLIGAHQGDKFLGFGFFEYFKGCAYYGSSAIDPEFHKLPVAHGIQWAAIEWLHKRGATLYEVGWQQFGLQIHDQPSEKEIRIAHFKRGFGGKTVPLFLGEKFYNKDYCQRVLQGRVEKLVKAMGPDHS